MEESIHNLSNELAKVEHGQLKAYADNGRIIFVIQNAPDELRRLADELERINIGEIKALVAYEVPKPKTDESGKPAAKPKKPGRGKAGR
ncbi:MAG: hypothetical protein ACYS22_17290 [Planctomycetota bacterium]|jgi:hypothetical protein